MKLLLLALLVLLGSAQLIRAADDDDASVDEEPETETSSDEEDDEGTEKQIDLDFEDDKPRQKVNFTRPEIKGSYHFIEYFDDCDTFSSRWIRSATKKPGADETIAKYDGEWRCEQAATSAIDGDYSLVLKSRARHHAIAAKLDRPFEFGTTSNPLVIQYDVKFQNGMECGGAYIKLLTHVENFKLNEFHEQTGYSIMFGPDKCGQDHKLHFIIRHRNPLNGTITEKHAKKPSASLDSFISDKRSHLYTLVIYPDARFEVLVDQSVINSGSLLEDLEPPINPPREIVDPADHKPADWDDREMIPDETAEKPDDWDESAPEYIDDVDATMPSDWLEDEQNLIPDPDATKPADWDEDMDGEWVPPQISNPKCAGVSGCGAWERPKIANPAFKGKWTRPLIPNPTFRGVWKPRLIPNPEYFEDREPFRTLQPIGAVGLELWSMTDGVVFDDFLVTDSKLVADELAAQTWEIKLREERRGSSGPSAVSAFLELANEKPYVWIMLVIVIALPIFLLIVYCCKKSPAPADSDARRKKRDLELPAQRAAPRAGAASTAAGPSDAAGGESTAQEDSESEAAGTSTTTGDDQQTARRRKPRKE